MKKSCTVFLKIMKKVEVEVDCRNRFSKISLKQLKRKNKCLKVFPKRLSRKNKFRKRR